MSTGIRRFRVGLWVSIRVKCPIVASPARTVESNLPTLCKSDISKMGFLCTACFKCDDFQQLYRDMELVMLERKIMRELSA